MNKETEPIVIGFPLRGEWLAPNTPGARIPSHGTDRLGARYAYDFLQVDWTRKGLPNYSVHWLRYFLLGVPLNKCYCWGKEIYAPCDGTVVEAKDHRRERARAFVLSDAFVAFRSARFFQPQRDDLQSVAGNYIILECEGQRSVYAAFAHLQRGSVAAAEGQRVKKGDVLGRIGHSGNSFFPHLHFQLMDGRDMAAAQGLPAAFERYEVFKNGAWETVTNGIPTDKDRIRFEGSAAEDGPI